MPTQSGLVVDFKKFDLVIGAGFRVDAYDAGGAVLAWQGDFSTVAVGADGVAVLVIVDNQYGIITVNNMMSAGFIDYVSAWVTSREPRPLSLRDRSGRTVLADPRTLPRQKAGMTWSAAHTPVSIDIHCPQLSGTVGGLLGA